MTGGYRERARPRTVSIPLGVAVLVVALLVSPWKFPEGSDGGAMFATAESLLTDGTLGIDPRFTTDDGYSPSARVGRGGRAYSKYGIGVPLLEMPFLAAGRVIARIFGVAEPAAIVAVLSLLNPMVTALTAVLLYLLCRHFVESRVACATATAYAFGTFAWVYANSDAADPVQALLITTSALLLVRYRKGEGRATLAASGVALAAAILAKPTNIVALPAFLLYLPILAWRRKKGVVRVETAMEVALFVAPVVASLMVVGWLNWLRFGSVFISGYPSRMFGTPFAVGLYGLLFSVNKGLLFHAPLVLLAPVGLFFMRRDELPDAALITLAFAAYVALYAKYDYWGGGWTWGPRYLLPVLPLLCVPVARVTGRFPLARLCAVALALAGLGFNSLGVVVNVEAYRATILDLWMPERTGIVQVGSSQDSRRVVPMAVPPEDVLPEFAPVLGHWWMLNVALAGCECDERTATCRCRSGRFDDRPAFLAAPWQSRNPGIRPQVPYGTRILRPWIAHWIHRHFLLRPGAGD